MLICPQCHFENSEKNNFCQKCGTSLKEKPCPQCGTKVKWSAKQCSNCNTITGTIWLAIASGISQSNHPDVSMDQSSLLPQVETENIIITGTAAADDSPPADSECIKTNEELLNNEFSAENSTPINEINLTKTPENPINIEEENTPADSEKIANIAAANLTEDRENTPIPENPIIPSEEANQEVNFPDFYTENSTDIDNQTNRNDAETDHPAAASFSGSSESITSTPTEFSDSLTEENPINITNNDLPGINQGEYLDREKRYQLLENLPPRKFPEIVTVAVLDCQPLQKSPLRNLPITENPFMGQIYLDMATEMPDNFPTVHDTWSDEQQSIVLVTDYSQLTYLSEQWSNPNNSPEQIVDWLEQMTNIWVKLEAKKCRQSLLEADNLYIEEEADNPMKIKVQRLYFDEEKEINITNLFQLWQNLFGRSQKTLFGPLLTFLNDLKSGQISDLDQLLLALKQLKDSINPTAEIVINQSNNLPLINIESYGSTDVGKQREHNEDYFSIWQQKTYQIKPDVDQEKTQGLYIICDGMGGHAGGEVASKLAVESLQNSLENSWQNELPDSDTLSQTVLRANNIIYAQNQAESRFGSARMGTTLVMALVQDRQAAIVHVGDSRLYCFTRENGLQQITIDHEVGQREIKRGIEQEIAYSRPDAYQLTQALGPRDDDFVRPEVQFLDLYTDTLLILASDGLTDNQFLETYGEDYVQPLLDNDVNLEKGVKELITLANTHNGHDNITAIVIRCLNKK